MWDFGRAELLEPEAIGEPGQRVFRLKVLSTTEAASLWLEKEQLAALTLAMRQLIEQADEQEDSGEEPEPVSATRSFPPEAEIDFKLGRLGIGYDERRKMVTIFAYAMDLEEDDPPTFACQVSLDQCAEFAEHAESAINAGRPLCVLCGTPIENNTHKCLRRNGHSKLPVSFENE
jgi:uncharacterized repeat protein (TIGR03847 family)